jgi:amino acid transporter
MVTGRLGTNKATDAQVPTHDVRQRVLGRRDMISFIFLTMVGATVTYFAAIGVSVVGWWILGSLLFLLPSSLIILELSTTYPNQGGVYDWVHRAFGQRMAARTSYWYWVNTGLWLPSGYLLVTGAITTLGWSSATLLQQSLVCVVLVWVTVAISLMNLKVGKLVTDLSSAAVLLLLAATIVGSFVLFVHRGSAANHFSVHAMLPNFGAAKVYLPTIVSSLLGMELVAALAGESKNPKRDMLWAVPVTGAALSVIQLLAIVGLLLVIPLKVLGLTSGMVVMYRTIFGGVSFLIPWMLGILLVATIFTAILPWSLGTNRMALEAARNGELPRVFLRETSSGAPAGATVLMGIVTTVVLLFAGLFIKTEDNLFYAMFAAASAVTILPRLLMFPAVVQLRRRDPLLERPFRVPGGQFGLWLCVLLSMGGVLSSLVLFLWTPGSRVVWGYTGPLLVVFVSAVVVGEGMVGRSLRRRSTSVTVPLRTLLRREPENW